jgi:anaerobic glycerol-3-phosphate dehydrogenase
MTIEQQLLNFFLTNFNHPRKKFRQVTVIRISDLPDEQASLIAELLQQRLNAETEPVAKKRLEDFKAFFESARRL